jgi:hypothetical protein
LTKPPAARAIDESMTPAFPLILAIFDATSAPILGVIEKFWIFLAIAIGSIIVEWLKKRHPPGEPASTDEAESHHSTSSTPSGPAELRPAATSDWEEELRRLLGGKPVAKPPPVTTPQQTAVPPPIRPVVIQAPRPVPARPPVTGAPTVVRSIPPLAGPAMAEAERSVDVQLPTLKESVTAYQRASHLQEQVIERLKHVEEMTERHLANVPTAHRQSVSADAAASIALIRGRKTVRQAIVVGLILGTPKGLENE